jgi:hypothetical protein
MRLTLCVLGTELFSVELAMSDPPEDEPETVEKFELGFRAPD